MIQWGIIGCGNVTEMKSGPAFNKVPGSKLVAVMRRNADKAKDYAQRHNVAKWYSNAQHLINNPDVNAIYIATPPVYHEPYAMDVIRAGKSVYLEKPMTMDAPAALRIAEAAEKKGVKISIAHYRRQQPQFLYIKNLLEEGTIGKVQQANLIFTQQHHTPLIPKTEKPWRLDPQVSGGGLFHDLAPHQLDLMVYFFGRAQKASGTSFNKGGFYEVDDIVGGEITFQNDITFTGSWNFSSKEKTDSCIIIGDKGFIMFNVFQNDPVILKTSEDINQNQFEPLKHVQQPMIQKVVEYFSGGNFNPCSATDGHHVMELIDAFTHH